MLGHLRQRDRSQFLPVVVGKTVLWPALTPQGPMRAGGADDAPTNSLQRRRHAPRLGRGPFAHAATENCNMSAAGLISPCSISSAITRKARDLAFRVASSGVAPYTVTPGSSGMSPIQRPSVSRSNRMVSCICLIVPLRPRINALFAGGAGATLRLMNLQQVAKSSTPGMSSRLTGPDRCVSVKTP